jgi:hypothetical protein
MSEGGVAMVICTSPATTSCIAGPAPLYGTCTTSIFVCCLKSSMPTCGTEPLPEVA